jgi:hypothetical protein
MLRRLFAVRKRAGKVIVGGRRVLLETRAGKLEPPTQDPLAGLGRMREACGDSDPCTKVFTLPQSSPEVPY